MGLAILPNSFSRILSGQSYWKAKLRSGKIVSEVSQCFDFRRGTRLIDWHLDIVGSGDNANIVEMTLCSPRGDVTFDVPEPRTAFIFQQGAINLFTGERQLLAQIAGKVTDKSNGACHCVIWDMQHQKLFPDFFTTVKDFASWHEDIARPKALNLAAMGVELL